MEIREEKISEYRETEQVVQEAFWNVYAPGCSEHYLVHRMRQCPGFVPALDLVAVEKGKIVGHVANVESYIAGDDGNRYQVLSLGPIAVLPQHQRAGVGSQLIAQVKRRGKQLGYRAILLCGDPAYYTKQGFEAAEMYRIRNGENQFADALLVCSLYEGALEQMAGIYYENSIYQVDPAAVKEFDRQFPPKTPVSGTPSQRRFLEMAARCKPFTPWAAFLTRAHVADAHKMDTESAILGFRKKRRRKHSRSGWQENQRDCAGERASVPLC